MEKMTKKEMYNEVIAMAKVAGREDVIAFAENEIALLDKKAAKAKESAAKKKAEGDALMVEVENVLTNEFQSIADIAASVVNCEDATVSKVQYRLSSLYKAGKAEKGEIKVPATETAKARTIVGYKRV